MKLDNYTLGELSAMAKRSDCPMKYRAKILKSLYKTAKQIGGATVAERRSIFEQSQKTTEVLPRPSESCARIPNKDLISSTSSRPGYGCDDKNVLWQGAQGLATYQQKHHGKPHRSVSMEHVNKYCECLTGHRTSVSPSIASLGSRFKGGQQLPAEHQIPGRGTLMRFPLQKTVEQGKAAIQKVQSDLKQVQVSDASKKKLERAKQEINKASNVLSKIDTSKLQNLEKNIGQTVGQLQATVKDTKVAEHAKQILMKQMPKEQRDDMKIRATANTEKLLASIENELNAAKQSLSKKNVRDAAVRLHSIHRRLRKVPKTEQDAIVAIKDNLRDIILNMKLVQKTDFALSTCIDCIKRAYNSLINVKPESASDAAKLQSVTNKMGKVAQLRKIYE